MIKLLRNGSIAGILAYTLWGILGVFTLLFSDKKGS